MLRSGVELGRGSSKEALATFSTLHAQPLRLRQAITRYINRP
jgi:hypothetical protein